MAEKQQLTKFAREQLGHYVYALRNPLDGTIFYVGKGNGDRVLAHANGVITAFQPGHEETVESLKNETIKKIHDAGREVESFIVQHGLSDHDHAFATESAVYGTLKLLAESLDHRQFKLTNKVAPPTFNHRGLRSVQQVLADYGQPADASLIPHNSMLIKPTLSGTWNPRMGREEVWEATRGWWLLNRDRLDHIRYVIAIPNFVVRGIWEVQPSDWRQQRRGDRGWRDILAQRRVGKELKPRLGFDSNIDVTESRFGDLLNTSIEEHFVGQAKRANVQFLDDHRVKALRKKRKKPFWNVQLT